MLEQKLDVTRSLYDSDGYRHCLVQGTPQQILTLLEGFYWLWDRASGKCLIEGMGAVSLGNSKPDHGALQGYGSRAEETRALLLAQRAMLKAAVSSASLVKPAPLQKTVGSPLSSAPRSRSRKRSSDAS